MLSTSPRAARAFRPERWLAALGLFALLALAGCQSNAPSSAAGPAPETAPVGDGCRPQESAFDCDRRAILAQAGRYRVSFAFDETAALRPGYTLRKPQRSGGEEWVFVVEDSGTRIVLQHILIGPGHVTKHWRQDWDYQPAAGWRYAGGDRWERWAIAPPEAHGAWLQSVWQVDDSPRYTALGRWTHDGNASIWTAAPAWRPLPRREHTTRADYDVLVSANRHGIAADGWVHLQDNLKLDTKAPPARRYLAREQGVNRYTRDGGLDIAAAEDYWRRTAPFWAQVRAGWAARLAGAESVAVAETIDGVPLWLAMLEVAEAPGDAAALKARVDEMLARYLTIAPQAVTPQR